MFWLLLLLLHFFFFLRRVFHVGLCFFSGSPALFMGPKSTLFRKKKNFKTGSHITIHTFKNYFVTMFQFSIFNKISGIQTNLYLVSNGSSFLSIKRETGSSPILSFFGVLHPKKDCLPTIKVKHIDNVASPWFLFASCEIAATLEIKFLYSLSFMRFFFFFGCIFNIWIL